MSDTRWYFAYGSNMQPGTFQGRRGIAPVRVVPARLAGWQLVFDKPAILPIGSGMANVVETVGAEVIGVAYAVTAADLEHIDLTEGVLIGNYQRVSVRVTPLAGGEAFEAITLTSDRRDPGLGPSRRYLSLLIEGAETHGLPPEYVAWLRSIATVEDTPQALEARAFIDLALKKKEPR